MAGFEARHGDWRVTAGRADGDFEAVAADGASIAVSRFDHDPLALVLIRRGGYAIGLARAGTLVVHRCGTRYVQSRTAAGGWSQQRYARRRAGQADALLDAVAGHAAALLVAEPGGEVRAGVGGAAAGPPTGVVLGGDRALGARLLAYPGLASLAGLPRRDLPDLPDPNLVVLRTAVARGRAVRILLSGDEPDDVEQATSQRG